MLPLDEYLDMDVDMRPVISLIAFREHGASRRFLHAVRREILNTPAAGTIDVYPPANDERQEGLPGPDAVVAALRRPAALTLVSAHSWADRDGAARTRWWIGGRRGGPSDGSWYFYLNELADRMPTYRVGATGGLLLDCCYGGSADFFHELAPYLDSTVPCLGVDGNSESRGARHLNLSVIRNLLDTPTPDLATPRVTAVMNAVARSVRRPKNVVCVRAGTELR